MRVSAEVLPAVPGLMGTAIIAHASLTPPELHPTVTVEPVAAIRELAPTKDAVLLLVQLVVCPAFGVIVAFQNTTESTTICRVLVVVTPVEMLLAFDGLVAELSVPNGVVWLTL